MNKKKEIDQQLLESIFTLENEWKQIQSLLENSIEPIDSIIYKKGLARAKYLFLLREARHRKINATWNY
ncbi:YaaL family protein [Virgibacillus alimentarius]|uniref:DUF2508 domain-containing protein n=1 Tax=Virgibacillus alimentarius TaxID=698769 RepID=A0ABS4S6J7_9BACI|nr:YaaL family protein [Virgibacillus alimentarius]MBP2257102.1 hypothetical protein [Virgibacillus alimentarius]